MIQIQFRLLRLTLRVTEQPLFPYLVPTSQTLAHWTPELNCFWKDKIAPKFSSSVLFRAIVQSHVKDTGWV